MTDELHNGQSVMIAAAEQTKAFLFTPHQQRRFRIIQYGRTVQDIIWTDAVSGRSRENRGLYATGMACPKQTFNEHNESSFSSLRFG